MARGFGNKGPVVFSHEEQQKERRQRPTPNFEGENTKELFN
jgi:hypothetical protein